MQSRVSCRVGPGTGSQSMIESDQRLVGNQNLGTWDDKMPRKNSDYRDAAVAATVTMIELRVSTLQSNSRLGLRLGDSDRDSDSPSHSGSVRRGPGRPGRALPVGDDVRGTSRVRVTVRRPLIRTRGSASPRAGFIAAC
jgi:hypothetical protein